MRLAPEIRDAADKYVRLRLSNMRGLDLAVFDFDYDLTWVALLLSPDGEILGRFGGRDATSPDTYRTLPALRYALEQGLLFHAKRGKEKVPPRSPLRAEDFPAAQKLVPRSCIHCHHVHEFKRADALAKNRWQPSSEYRYPDPKTLGIDLDPVQGNRVKSAAKPLAKGDVILEWNGSRIRSYADIVTALDRSGAQPISLVVQRDGNPLTLEMRPAAKWKEKTDISWRWSLKSLLPEPPVSGENLSDADRKALGIDPGKLALRQGPFLRQEARQAGVQIGDVIVAVDGKSPALTAAQFDVFYRLNVPERKQVTLDIRRASGSVRVVIKAP